MGANRSYRLAACVFVVITPTTHAIAEFSTGAASAPGRIAVGPDGLCSLADTPSAVRQTDATGASP